MGRKAERRGEEEESIPNVLKISARSWKIYWEQTRAKQDYRRQQVQRLISQRPMIL